MSAPRTPPTPPSADPLEGEVDDLGEAAARGPVALAYLLVGLVFVALVIGLVIVAADAAKFPLAGG